MQPPEIMETLLGHALDAYLDALQAQVDLGRKSSKTYSAYRSVLYFFCREIGPMKIMEKIGPQDIDRAIRAYAVSSDRRYHGRKISGKSVASQKLFVIALQQFFLHAQRVGWVTHSPMAYASLAVGKGSGHSQNPRRAALSLDQCQRLIEASGTLSEVAAINQRNQTMLTVLCVLGPRLSELIGMDASVVDADRWVITGKGQKVRSIPLSPVLRDSLSTWRVAYEQAVTQGEIPRVDDQAMFVGVRGKRILASSVQDMLNQAASVAGLGRGVMPHALRHTAATLMLASGWDVKVVAQMLGHENIATTARYLDELPGELDVAISAHPLGKMLAR